MFRKFFAALSALTTNTEALAASFAEANKNFRRNLALDSPASADDVPALEHEVNGDGKRKARARG